MSEKSITELTAMKTNHFFLIDIDRAKELAAKFLDSDQYNYELVDCIEYLAIAKDKLRFLASIPASFEKSEVSDGVFIESDIELCLLRIAALEIAIATLEAHSKFAYVSQVVAVKSSDMWRLDSILNWYQLEADTLQSLNKGRLAKDNPDIHGDYRLYQGYIKL